MGAVSVGSRLDLPASVELSETRRMAADLVALAILSAFTYLVQKLLFPLEGYWLYFAGGLFAFALLQRLLVRKGLVADLFFGLDGENARAADGLPLLIAPVAIAGALSAVFDKPFVFVLPVLWVLCVLQGCISAMAARWLVLPEMGQRIYFPKPSRPWLGSIFFAVLIYAVAFFASGAGKPVQAASLSGPVVLGTWFTIPVQKSDLFPMGYGRLEDSVFDDFGRVFVAGVGQSLGLVEPCRVAGPDLSQSAQARIPSPLVQPRFNYAVEAMCAEWVATLPDFFWKIGLLGVFLLALVVGIGGFGDPAIFAVLSLVLLLGWVSWPAPGIKRVGNVAVLVAGMPLIALVFPVFRRRQYSLLMAWGLLSGVAFGLAGFVRRPCGLALVATAVVILLYCGLRDRRMLLAIAALLAVFVGNSLVTTTVNALLSYRDVKLQINAPKISPLFHGAGYALLGGVGGRALRSAAGTVPQYQNSLDTAFLDAAIWYVVYNENPMIGFAQKSFSLMQDTGRQVYLRYVTEHPLEYAWTSLRKTYEAALLVLGPPNFGVSVALLVLALMGIWYVLSGRRTRGRRGGATTPKEMIGAFMVLVVAAAIPAILTAPYYGESVELPAVVLFFGILVAIHYLAQALASTNGPA